MARYGIKVAKPGKSAKSSNLLDEIIDNQYPFLKAFKQGVVSVNVTGAGTYTIDVTHGLGYFPTMIYFVAPDPANPTRKFFGSSAANGPGGQIGNEAFIDKTKIRFGWQDTSVGGAFAAYPYKVSFYYYIFYDKLE